MKYVILIHSNPQPWGHPTGEFVAEFQALPKDQRDAMNADFERVSANGAVARNADLSGVWWHGGSLTGAKFTGADLRGAAFDLDWTDAELPPRWEQDTVVSRRMAFDHYFGANAAAKKI